MPDEPTVDGRRREAIREHVELIAPYYVDEWDPDADGPGATLVSLFAELTEDVVERLDRAPAKHRVAFYNALGFDRRPATPATVPLTVEVAPEAPENVHVEPGTEVVASATDDRPEQTFRVPVGEGFEATPARLTDIVAVEPRTDSLYDHSRAIGGTESATLFAGDDRQMNALYISHADLLAIEAGSTIEVVCDADASPTVLRNELIWEYYGEKPGADGDPVEGWHELTRPAAGIDIGVIDIPPWIGLPTASVQQQAETMVQQSRRSTAGNYSFTAKGAKTEPIDLAANVTRSRPTELRGHLSLTNAMQALTFAERPDEESDDGDGENGPVTIEFEPDGSLLETPVNGIESRWIRCRVPDAATPTGEFDISIDHIGLRASLKDLQPDMLLANDVPQSGEENETITPFGEEPTRQDTFYIGSAEAFTKHGADVTLSFSGSDGTGASGGARFPPPVVPQPVTLEESTGKTSASTVSSVSHGPQTAAFTGATTETPIGLGMQPTTPIIGWPGGPGTGGQDDGDDDGPVLSWEYWNGNGWRRILGVDDGTDRFKSDGQVTFTVPPDAEETTVAGHDGVWIRVRLVSGTYGDVIYVDKGSDGKQWERQQQLDPPRYEDVGLEYQYPEGQDPHHLLPYNNLSYGRDLVDQPHSFHPFETVPNVDQTLYLGFSKPLHGGPIGLFADLADHEYPEDFAPRVRWEYCIDSERDEWTSLDGTDDTDGLREQGIATIAFPEVTSSFERFGRDRHWIRARVRGDLFGPATPRNEAPETGRAPTLAAADTTESTDSVEELEACGEVVETVPPAGVPTNVRPSVDGLFANAGWAINVSVIERELVGGSDGSPDQSFTVAQPPIIDATVWVDELTSLTEGEREELVSEQPDRVEIDSGDDGDPRAVWVRWERVDDLHTSEREDRHYVLDRVAGDLRFGDDVNGRIPPRGDDNIEITYRTGGGPAGNVAPGAVDDLKRALPYVDAVTNPAPGSGGAPAESPTGVQDRAARTLRDRGRAVTPADFERIAMTASRRLARARCLPDTDRSGQHAPGWVTVLIVPNDQRRRPVPSVGLRDQVERAVSERAPASLVAKDRLVVRGPSYVAVHVDATVVGESVESVATVEREIERRLTQFLHPLTGGPSGDGWAFGDLPDRSSLYTLLEGTDGVDYVSSLDVTYEGSAGGVITTEGEPTPSVARDALVASGEHDVRVRLGGRTPSQREGR